ncbi:MAG: hypothetical protein ABIF71_07905 [Planctomycetota bacterium]
MLLSTRTTPEPRVILENAHIKVDFAPRTSDTMYNYIWVRNAISGEWERVHNFGIDIRAYRTDNGELINSDFLIPIRNRACFSEKGLALFPTHR